MPLNTREIILLLLVVALFLWELLQLRRKKWFVQWLSSVLPKPKTLEAPKIRQMKPKSEKDCPLCQKEQANETEPQACPHTIIPWSEMKKDKGGRPKQSITEGHACLEPECYYYGITDQTIHALVADGSHGKREKIGDLICQACQAGFSRRRNTPLYRLKTPSEVVQKIMLLEAHGVETAVLEGVYQVRESTIRTWLARGGEHGRKLHDHFFRNLLLDHVQLDELWGHVKRSGEEVGVWTTTEAKTKIIPVIQVGERSQAMAYSVLHELKSRLAEGCLPIFSSDGLKHYFYASTAHFGFWHQPEAAKKTIWMVWPSLLYGQVIKHHQRRKLLKVEQRVLCGEKADFVSRLKALGLTGIINTSFIERLNLTIREGVSKLARRTWSLAQYTPELVEHLFWWLAVYHVVRYHEELRETLAEPGRRKGRQTPRKYRQRTPAVAAGIVSHRWTVRELLSYPLL
jgi:IS1 family transposase